MRLMAMLKAGEGSGGVLKEWLVREFGPAQARRHGQLGPFIVNVATVPPAGLVLYGANETNSGDEYDAVLEASFADRTGLSSFVDALNRDVPVDLPVHHGYAVRTRTVLHRPGFSAGLPTPGYKLLRGLYLHEDLSDAAAERCWKHHEARAAKVHVGLARYARHWVEAQLTPDAPAVRGFSDLHFPDADSMIERYFDSDRGREEILHDIGHFIRAGLNRVFAREYVFGTAAAGIPAT